MDEILSSMLTQTKDAKAEDSVEENKSYPYSDIISVIWMNVILPFF